MVPFRTLGWAVILTGAVLAWRGAGAAEAPATASRPALDLRTPQSALLEEYGALRGGDVAAAKRCLTFADAAEAENFDLTVAALWAPQAFLHAMEARFGQNARKFFSAEALDRAADQAIDEINHADITITGDTAVVCDKRAAADACAENLVSGITLKKQGDQWRIVAATFPEMSGQIPAAQIAMMRTLAKASLAACRNTQARLEKGDFKTADEAYGAYQKQLQAANLPAPPPPTPR